MITEYVERSGLTQSQPSILSARLSRFKMQREEGNEGEKETERGRRNDDVKLVEAKAEVRGRGDPQHWDSVSVS